MLPRGSMIDILVKDQSDFGTPATGNYTRTSVYTVNLSEKAPLEDDPLLGLPRQNNRDTTSSAPGLPSHDGTVVAPLDLSHIGLWLKGAFGAPVTTGSDPDYVHTFTSGGETLPARTVELKVPTTGSNIFMQHVGQMVNRLTFEISRAPNYQRVNIDLVGKKENKLTSTGGGTPAASWVLNRMLAAQGVFKLGGVVAEIMSITGTYDNKLKGLDFAGDTYVSGYDADDMASFSGSIRLRFKTAAMYDLAIAGALSAAEMLWQQTSARSFSLSASNMKLERAGIDIGGPVGIEQSFNFRCEQSASAAMLTAVLKNSVASY